MYKVYKLIMIGIVMIDRIDQGEKDLKVMSRSEPETRKSYLEQEVEETIRLAIKGIRFGSVEIIVHDSKGCRSNGKRSFELIVRNRLIPGKRI